LDETFEIRLFLETPALEKVARIRPSPLEGLKHARGIYVRLKEAADAGDMVKVVETDTELHVHLVSLAGNKRLTRLIAELRERMYMPGLRRLAAAGRVPKLTEEHLELIEAIENGNPEETRRIAERHIRGARADWVHGSGLVPEANGDHDMC
jgi:DNA-binding GntR family transcriptional regulator